MGICLSCCGNESQENNENNERSRLLNDPTSGSSNNYRTARGDDYMSRSSSALPRKDERTGLSQIVEQTAHNVINVGALDYHDLEQHEYYERMKGYHGRLNSLTRWVPPVKQHGLLLVDSPFPDKLLSADPITVPTLHLVSSALDALTEAVAEVKVEHKEDLVVPFRIP